MPLDRKSVVTCIDNIFKSDIVSMCKTLDKNQNKIKTLAGHNLVLVAQIHINHHLKQILVS